MKIGYAVLFMLLMVGCRDTAPAPHPDHAAPPAGADQRVTPVHVRKGSRRLRAPEPFHRVTLEDLEATHGLSHIDRFHLRVETRAGRDVEMRFIANYGNVSVDIIPAFPDGEALLCMKAGRGRGTNTHAETLAVFRLGANGWDRVAWLPISWWDLGPERKMLYHRYHWSLADQDGDGTAEIVLTADSLSDAERDPVVYRWDSRAGRFAGPPGAPPTNPEPDEMWRSVGWVLSQNE